VAEGRTMPWRGGKRRWGTPRKVRMIAVGLTVAAFAATCGATLPNTGTARWASPGLVGGGGWPYNGVPLTESDGEGASYIPGSSVVRLADGQVRLVPFGGDTTITVEATDPRVKAAVRSDQLWLSTGTIPDGGSAVPMETRQVYREMATRALLDLRLLTRPNGASLASWYGAWRYTWPRDSAFTAAAFTMTGHTVEARHILEFLADVQHEDGLWAARYHADGGAVTDGREPQLDSLGWVLWASWLYLTQTSSDAADLWRMVARAADHLADSLGDDGLPPPSSDYWERKPGTEQDPHRATLGVAGPVLAGLRSAAYFADSTGHAAKAASWRRAANRLSSAISQHFAPYGYPRSPVPGGRMDTSVTFVAPPFAPLDAGVATAVANAFRRTSLPNGGVLPGEMWAGNPDVAWTPEMALFALTAASSGRLDEAMSHLDWLAAHRTPLGVLPEKVSEDGEPASVAPLGWTASLVLLTLSSLERPLPIPGAPS
jgi:hypothetical protein